MSNEENKWVPGFVPSIGTVRRELLRRDACRLQILLVTRSVILSQLLRPKIGYYPVLLHSQILQ